MHVPAHPPNHHQLSSAQCHRTSAHHDDAVGMGGGTSRCIQHRRGIQHCPANTAADFDIAEPGNLDPMFLLRKSTSPPICRLTLKQADTRRNGLRFVLSVWSFPSYV
jgi:hypothetical protein